MKKDKIDLSNTLFVCGGNVFRSPFAEIYFNLTAKEKDLNYFSISRGTSSFYSHPNSAVVKIAYEYGVDLSKHIPKVLISQDVENVSAVFVMDNENRDQVLRMHKQTHKKLYNLGHFLHKPKDEIMDVKVINIKKNIYLVKSNFNLIVQAINNILNI